MQETQKTQIRLSFLTNKTVIRKIIFEVLNPKDKTKIEKKTSKNEYIHRKKGMNCRRFDIRKHTKEKKLE